MERVQQTIEQQGLLVSGDSLVIGVSGGPDSMVLMDILRRCRHRYQLSLHVVHVNHMFRGEQAKEEAEFVERTAREWDIPCTVFHCDVPAYIKESGMSTQAAGHAIRFRCFAEVMERVGANKLALGHHQDDRVESVLLHIIQGCGIEGLATMAGQDKMVIRPLIEVTKQEVVQYCEENQLEYRLDPSNQKDIYLRNKVRLNLLPLLEEQFNPRIKEGVLKLEELARVDNEFIEIAVDTEYQKCVQEKQEAYVVDLVHFDQLHLALKRRIIRKIYQQLLPKQQGLDFQGVDQVLSLAAGQTGYKKTNLAKGVLVEKKYNQLILSCQQGKPSVVTNPIKWESALVQWSEYYFEKEEVGSKETGERDWNHVVLDADLVGEDLWIRGRENGDRIKPIGLQGSKKLKDFFIDRKVPATQRDQWPIVTNDREIVWIPGYTIGDRYKVTAATKRYLRLSVSK